MQLRTLNHCERTCIYSVRKLFSHGIRMGHSHISQMIENSLFFSIRMVYELSWKKGEDALLDSTPAQNPFRFRKQICCPVSPASHEQFRIPLQENLRNMHLLISFDRLSKSHRNKGSTISVQVLEETDERYFRRRWGCLVRRPCPFSDRIQRQQR